MPLRICADPHDMPFSNRAAQGFDNRIATLLARDLHREPVFVFARSRRGFLREQFNKGACDVLMGVPQGMKSVATTEPYYRSTYVFVTPVREHSPIVSFDDPRLNGRRIGLQVLEENLSPPSLPLIRSGHAAQLVGFESFGGETTMLRAVARGSIGAAVVWGPVAGYYAALLHLPVTLSPVSPAVDRSGIPFAYSLTVGVRKNDPQLLKALNTSLARMQPRIDSLLHTYHVPIAVQPGGSR
ncbi:MAG TPA: quinoprotein dehydrogenase-associated putative ABC transporter substrate-binding protein [Acidobacteriaceae bacterium]